jgi:predicted RNA-binding protein with PUA-like domain
MESITLEQFELLSKCEKEEWNRYGYYDSRDGLIKRETDDGVYFNHSEEPNVIDVGDTMVAKTNIQIGEELTVDYRPYYLPGEKMPAFIATNNHSC